MCLIDKLPITLDPGSRPAAEPAANLMVYPASPARRTGMQRDGCLHERRGPSTACGELCYHNTFHLFFPYFPISGNVFPARRNGLIASHVKGSVNTRLDGTLREKQKPIRRHVSARGHECETRREYAYIGFTSEQDRPFRGQRQQGLSGLGIWPSVPNPNDHDALRPFSPATPTTSATLLPFTPLLVRSRSGARGERYPNRKRTKTSNYMQSAGPRDHQLGP